MVKRKPSGSFCHVMALSMKNDDLSLIMMIKNGAHGYLLKDIQPKELDNALQSMIKNGFYYPDRATSKIPNLLEFDYKIIFTKGTIVF
ncbi:hypothetical protein [Chryseobacterium salviniae]|uniref:Response regulatory domain-containing protein n=1 Tax=Chryseobacterium salviniae TaxID=3101750 RepID=A0ABU6HPY2_9FLAO|nr:hypothetical protein [Chryseobacterium sp. T9W2-O]MEC3874993.1 hypothetical protein [Chryseobacterium sp. T9W2-O]